MSVVSARSLRRLVDYVTSSALIGACLVALRFLPVITAGVAAPILLLVVLIIAMMAMGLYALSKLRVNNEPDVQIPILVVTEIGRAHV